MFTKTEAEQIAHDWVKTAAAEAGIDIVLLNQSTMERDFGWVFFYQSKRHIETGDISDALAGNAPIVVMKVDGSVHATGTARPLEHYLKKFER